MLRKKRIAITTALAVAALTATPSSGNVSRTIYLLDFVPVYCNVELSPTIGGMADNGIIDLGR